MFFEDHLVFVIPDLQKVFRALIDLRENRIFQKLIRDSDKDWAIRHPQVEVACWLELIKFYFKQGKIVEC